MMNKGVFGASMDVELVSPRIIKPLFLVSSIWDVEHFRRKARGAIYEWALLSKDLSFNLCTTEGLNRLLDVMFHGTTQITAWYIGLFEDDYTPLAANTYASPGCNETTAYDEATRPAYNEAAASSKVTTNAANKAEFTFNDTKTIYGGILVGGGTAADTKDDAAGGGCLYASCRFSSSKGVVDDDILKVTVALTAADA